MYVLILLWFFLDCSLCSVGDRSNDFRSCSSRCSSLSCEDPNQELPFALKLTGWTCLEECQYQCMHQVTAEDVRLKRPVRQFFGKVSAQSLTLKGQYFTGFCRILKFAIIIWKKNTNI